VAAMQHFLHADKAQRCALSRHALLM
jgi:hypothetical protein